MRLNREEEVVLFRNINGSRKKWNLDERRKSFVDSSEEFILRQNQGKGKAKFIKAFLSNKGKDKILKGVDIDVGGM